LLQILWKPVDEVLICTENAEEPESSTDWATEFAAGDPFPRPSAYRLLRPEPS
jgi:hypothetical protein